VAPASASNNTRAGEFAALRRIYLDNHKPQSFLVIASELLPQDLRKTLVTTSDQIACQLRLQSVSKDRTAARFVASASLRSSKDFFAEDRLGYFGKIVSFLFGDTVRQHPVTFWFGRESRVRTLQHSLSIQ
jgi:hypothetical protein